MPRYALGADGYFTRDGARFVPFGANWWPGSAGVELWQRFDGEEIRRDLDLAAGLGMNCLRFFLRWQDFEPDEGSYDDRQFARLADFVRWCGERGLAAHPSLFVGFMSGGVFWPRWKAGRNLFSDPGMVERAVAFAGRAAQALAPVREHVLAVDQGNELCCLAESAQAPPAAVAAWCAAINAAVRSVLPDMVMISGNEQNQVVGDTGWRFDAQPGCDLLSMHAYPVPTWHPIGFDGMTDPLCQSLLPFYTACARAFAPVFVQEFGTIVTFGSRQQDAYLRAILPACWQAGANGFLWWCLRDIRAPVMPYLKCGFEGTLGLVDDAGRVKPGLEHFLEFGRGLATRPAPEAGPPEVGIWWPRSYYPRDDPGNPGNDPRTLSVRMIRANHAAQRLGRRTGVVRGDRPLDAAVPAIVVPGALLRVDEAEALIPWVEAGGRLVWIGPDPVNWGPAYIRLLGARPVDYRAVKAVDFAALGQRWSCPGHPRGMRCEVVADAAEVVARDGDMLPTVLRHRLGRGQVVAVLPMVEEQLDAAHLGALLHA